MRVVIVGPFPLDVRLVRGGVESSVLGLATALVEAGHEVSVFDLPRKGGNDCRETLSGVQVFRFANNGRFNFLSVLSVKRYLKFIQEESPDVCHLHNTSVFSYQLYRSIRSAGIRVLLTVHGLACVEQRKKLSRKWSFVTWMKYVYQRYVEKQLLTSGVGLIVDTEYVRHHIISNYHCDVTSIQVIPQGVDASYFAIENRPQDNRIFSLGAFQPRKGQIVMLRMFAEVKKEIPNAKLVLMGAVSDSLYYQMLHDEWERSPYKQDVLLCPNADADEVKRQYEQARIFALYTAEESQGIVFCEAMAVGLPIVATNVGGVPYVVNDEHYGLLSDYGDEQKFVSNIVSLLRTKIEESHNDEIRKRAADYCWDAIARRIMIVYEQL